MRSRSAEERGSATAELAVALPAVAVVLACCLGAIAVAAEQVRLTDAAADAARALARGEGEDRAVAIARRVAGAAAELAVAHDGDIVCAHLSVRPRALPLTLGASACALAGGG